MVEPAQLVGTRLALLLVGEDEQGQDECVVFAGTVREEDGRLCWDHERGTLELRDEWLERIQPAAAEVQDILLDAAYVLMLAVGNLQAGVSPEGFEPTGLKWPSGTEM